MFLSEAQLAMINESYQRTGLDLLEANISTVSALITRGIIFIDYGKISKVVLTDVGETIAANLDAFYSLPKYKTVLDKTRTMKYGANENTVGRSRGRNNTTVHAS